MNLVLLDGPDDRGTAVLTLNDPDNGNALSPALREEVAGALRDLAADTGVKALIVTGAGGCFSADVDPGGPAIGDPGDLRPWRESLDVFHEQVLRFPVPTIAAVDGLARTGGFELALLCDLRIVTPEARLAHPGPALGPVVHGPLHDLVGGAVAGELALTGREVDGAEALSLRLAAELVPSAGLLARAVALAHTVSRGPREALVAGKAALVRRRRAGGRAARRSATSLGRPVGLRGTGLYVPRRVVPNAELTRTLDTSDEWIVSRTGIRERRFLEDSLATSDMCVAAGRQALARSGVPAAELDALIVTTYTADQPLPSTALMVKDALGAERAMPLDFTQAACAGGVYALLVAAHLLQNDGIGHVLVIGADCASRVTHPADRATRVFFGDAAGAVVLGRTEPGHGLLSWDIGSQLSYEVQIPAGGSRLPRGATAREHFLQMNGKAVWDTAVTELPRSIRRTVERAGVSMPEIRYFLLHQANLNIIKETMKDLGSPLEHAPTTVQRLGNTGAAGMFTVLHETMTKGVRSGELLVLAGIGAGFMWGSACFRHHGGEQRCSR
ncbi:beta-ketoacyl-ACP synthase 3 [Actinomadura rubrisoli]|uniref:Beta-ketoacyl-ACP synthase 3 n=1 Tax=Actinomadura rubrisoli TaxID=2530368 RepID=A0A4R5BFB4_9ACTN|nr:beta-ketoacyl-ACP synthase 3 [Actinomadura rubrisoli]TDD85031.1 beta-ketoacyl-ACP synthase 3 [Actinomadura rubrisoli]